ncbi:MAG: endolytic transglycosylase MltG [Chloroflexota bacterium]|nr:endolytic transglycosylase MltG [Chloroflexota bacterium]
MRVAGLALQVVAIGIVSLFAFIYVAYSAVARLTEPPTEVAYKTLVFQVEFGASVGEIGSDLQDAGLIRNSLIFRMAVSRRGLETQMQAGDYLLRENMSMNQIIQELQHGEVEDSVITVLEGWRAEEIADALAEVSLISREEFMQVVREGLATFDYDFLPGPGGGLSLEGFLFPDTYRVGMQTTAEDFVAGMLLRFDEVYSQAIRDAAEELGLTPLEVVTLASIVEREASLDDERARIAAVFLNRLDRGMRLEADPTVQYAVAPAADGGWWESELTVAHLQTDSPYNTYFIEGLPVGPIANPGVSSILAVVEPEETEELFFVARGDDSHAFAETLDEHERNVERYLR